MFGTLRRLAVRAANALVVTAEKSDGVRFQSFQSDTYEKHTLIFRGSYFLVDKHCLSREHIGK